MNEAFKLFLEFGLWTRNRPTKPGYYLAAMPTGENQVIRFVKNSDGVSSELFCCDEVTYERSLVIWNQRLPVDSLPKATMMPQSSPEDDGA